MKCSRSLEQRSCAESPYTTITGLELSAKHASLQHIQTPNLAEVVRPTAPAPVSETFCSSAIFGNVAGRREVIGPTYEKDLSSMNVSLAPCLSCKSFSYDQSQRSLL